MTVGALKSDSESQVELYNLKPIQVTLIITVAFKFGATVTFRVYALEPWQAGAPFRSHVSPDY